MTPVRPALLRLPVDHTIVDMPERDRIEAIQAAFYRTASPHEWEWTARQQELMAHYCLWAAQRLGIVERTARGDDWEAPNPRVVP